MTSEYIHEQETGCRVVVVEWHTAEQFCDDLKSLGLFAKIKRKYHDNRDYVFYGDADSYSDDRDSVYYSRGKYFVSGCSDGNPVIVVLDKNGTPLLADYSFYDPKEGE